MKRKNKHALIKKFKKINIKNIKKGIHIKNKKKKYYYFLFT